MVLMLISRSLALAAFAVSGVLAQNAVKLPTGVLVEGKASGWKPEVSEYLGIPFAQPPVGELRWRAPRPFKGNSSTISAKKYSPTCPANVPQLGDLKTPGGAVLGLLSQYGDKYDEDCLTVNVWTKPQSGEKKKAVMAWIYGGGYGFGNSGNPIYNGARLANDHDVVVVGMNYRLNVFGFPGAPGLPDQNLGLLDQRLAVEWIRDNIEAFGGDPARITLFGESAGGASTDMYAYAWTKDPIVNGFIAQSGTRDMGGMIGISGNISRHWYDASRKVGCGGAEVGEATVACMQKKPWREIMNATLQEGILVAFGGMGLFGPMVDEKVVFSDYYQRNLAGNFVKKPMLVGNNVNEMALFSAIIGITSPEIINSPLSKPGNAVFDCPTADAAYWRSFHKVKAWRYRYDGQFANVEVAPQAGAFHASEIPLIFGTTQHAQQYLASIADLTITIPDSPAETELMKTMMTAWTSFAKDPERGLDGLKWPVYDQLNSTIIALGGLNDSRVSFQSPAVVDIYCPMANSLLAMAGPGSVAKIIDLISPYIKPGTLLGSLLPTFEIRKLFVTRMLSSVDESYWGFLVDELKKLE